jgi:hypothetical protein
MNGPQLRAAEFAIIDHRDFRMGRNERDRDE